MPTAERRARDAAGGHRRPAGRAPKGFPDWDRVHGVYRNNEGATMEEAHAFAGRAAILAAMKAQKAATNLGRHERRKQQRVRSLHSAINPD